MIAVLVWMLGVELGPGLHIARHGEIGHHHHDAAEALACSAHGQTALDVEVDHGAHDAMAVRHEQRAADEHHEHAGHHEHAEHHEHAGHHEHARHHEHAGHHEPPDPIEHPTAVEHERGEHHAAVEHEHPRATHEPHPVPHGAGSLAHRDLVPLTPPLVLPPIVSAPWQPFEVATVLHVAPSERSPAVFRARGPPNSVLLHESLALV